MILEILLLNRLLRMFIIHYQTFMFWVFAIFVVLKRFTTSLLWKTLNNMVSSLNSIAFDEMAALAKSRLCQLNYMTMCPFLAQRMFLLARLIWRKVLPIELHQLVLNVELKLRERQWHITRWLHGLLHEFIPFFMFGCLKLGNNIPL